MSSLAPSDTETMSPSSPTATTRASVLLVDDHEVVRDGLRLIIDGTPDLRVCADVPNIDAARLAVEQHGPAVAVIDLSLENGGDGLQLVKWMHAQHRGIKIVVSSMHDESLYGERALRAGASGYVSKSAPARTVLDAIRAALSGQLHFSAALVDAMLRRAPGTRGRTGIEQLSDRELQVFRGIGQGRASKEIAEALHLSVSTVDTYRERLKTKLGISSGAELVNRATRWMLEHP